MGTTPHLGFPELSQGQANPDITFNTNLRLNQCLHNGVIDRTNTPPVSPSEQDGYLIGPAPTGVWTGKANLIACYIGGEWKYIPGNDDNGTQITMGADQEGLRVYVRDEDAVYTWRALASSPATFGWSTAAYTATEIANTPSGNIAATDVQAAINELDSEKLAVAGHAAVSVVGRAANSSGAAADIAAAANDRLLARTADSVAFQQLTNGMVPTNTLGLDKLANASAQYNLIGRTSPSGGAWEQKQTSSDVFAMLGAANNAAILAAIGAPGVTEGTFTPTLTFATPGDLNVAYSTRNGRYTRIGNIVYFEIDITTSTFTHTTASGKLLVTGLPFTSRAANVSTCAILFGAFTGVTNVEPVVQPSVSQIEFFNCAAGTTIALLTPANLTSGSSAQLFITGWYRV